MSGSDGFDPFDHVTEREPWDGTWEDCTFAALLETLRLGFADGVAIPPTIAEVNALRADAGLPEEHHGATLFQAEGGAKTRYGLASGYVLTQDWGRISYELLETGALLVVQGSMAHVPAHLRRWSPGFTGAHAVAARGGPVAPTWCDPLAPKGTYVGEPVSIATWQAFFHGQPGAWAFITHTGALSKESHMVTVTDPNPRTLDLAAGKMLYDLDGHPFTENAIPRNDLASPFGSGGFRAVIIGLTGYNALLFVRGVDVTDSKPVSTGDVKHVVGLTIDGITKHSETF